MFTHFLRRIVLLPAVAPAGALFWGLSHLGAFYEEHLSKSRPVPDVQQKSDTLKTVRQNVNSTITQVNIQTTFATNFTSVMWHIYDWNGNK